VAVQLPAIWLSSCSASSRKNSQSNNLKIIYKVIIEKYLLFTLTISKLQQASKVSNVPVIFPQKQMQRRKEEAS
jgi:hypothetical protein